MAGDTECCNRPSTAMNQGYNGGRILRVYMENFMIHKKFELIPSEGLNLIIGSNGSGKSSIVCAICLGLAGKPTVTGRKMQLNEYIAHGKDYAYIEIELDDPFKRSPLVISRKIKLDGKSHYRINKKTAKEQEVEEELRRFNIQVTNLCQFLAQDKVGDFSRMNSKQLLESMQQAVGDQEMFNNYKKLIEMQVTAQKMSEEFELLGDEIEKEEKRNQTLDPAIQIFKERETYIKRLELLEKTILLLKYRTHCESCRQWKDKKHKISEEKKELQEDLAPLICKVEEMRNVKKVVEGNISSINNEAARLGRAAIQSTEEICNCAKQVAFTHNEFENRKATALQRRQLAEQLIQQILAKEKSVLVKQKKIADMKTHIDQVKLSKQKLNEKTIQLSAEQWNINYQLQNLTAVEEDATKKLKEYNSSRHNKIHVLRLRHRNTCEALQWLEKNRTQFKKLVFDPLLLLIEVNTDTEAMFLENHISFRDLILFLCEDKEDAKKLTKILRQDLQLAVNVAVVPSKPITSYKSRVSIEELQNRYHFKKYLRDIFKAPEPVLRYLCEMYYIHDTPCGDESTEQYLSRNEQKLPFQTYYTTSFKYKSKQSLYGPRNTSVISTHIKKKGLLLPTCKDIEERKVEELKKLQEANIQKEGLNQRNAEICIEKQNLEEQLKHLKNEELKYQNENRELESFKRDIEKDKQLLSSLEKIDVEAERQEYCTRIALLMNKRGTSLNELDDVTQKLIQSIRKRIRRQLQLSIIREKIKKLENVNERKTTTLKIKENEYEEACHKFKTAKEETLQHLQKAEAAFGMPFHKPENRLKIREMLSDISDNMEEVEGEIASLKARLACMNDINQESIDDYHKRKKLIKELKVKYEAMQKELNSLTAKIESKKLEWIVPLKNIIKKVNTMFSNYFKRLDCAGEVVLTEGDNANNFDQYGLSIQVKFRDSTRLTELSHSHHSGGECSVSTMLFILSLQELTAVPFRCVDEINQGMDSINERQVFNIIAECAAKSSQYFLLTPKLLHGLDYPTKMKIHIIHNGPMLDVQDWNIKKFTKRIRQTKGQ